MSAEQVSVPFSVTVINRRLQQIAGSQSLSQPLKRAVANVVLGQLLPPGAVKGGAAIKFRLGNDTTRFTQDLDMARTTALRDFVDELQQNLTLGWAGFTGHLVARGGLPHPHPIPVLPLEHQIAQKLHACSEPGSDRAHDLVDLQLLAAAGLPHLGLIDATCRRLFASRNRHRWPTTVVAPRAWESLYLIAVEDLSVLPDVYAATAWLNEVILALQAAPPPPT